MASTDALPVPQKNVAYRVTFPIMDADGDLVTAAGSLDSEISKDGGTFADCTNEATEIATSSGMYFLDLTSTEMNADTVAIIVKSTGGKTTPIVLYPEEAGNIRVNLTQWLGSAPNALVSSRVDSSVGAVAANAITAAAIADGAIDDAAVAADMDTYQAKVWVFDDNGGTTDRYVAVWHKNGQPVTSGITSPTIQVIKVSDGTDLIASGAMTEIASLGMYKKDEGTNRMVSGAAYVAKVTASIDSGTRTWFQPVGRDSS